MINPTSTNSVTSALTGTSIFHPKMKQQAINKIITPIKYGFLLVFRVGPIKPTSLTYLLNCKILVTI